MPEKAREKLYAPWIWYASGKLKTCGLLREKQWIYACDDANTIYLLDHAGTLIAQTRINREVTAVAAAENGTRIVVGCRTGHLLWLDQELETAIEIEWARDISAVAIDPYGEYAVACTSECNNLVVNAAGKKVSEFKTRQAQRFAAFVPTTGSIVLSAENGHVSSYSIYGQAEWSSGHWTNIGGMAVSGDGDAVLLAGFSHGILRYNSEGRKEGIYRL